MRLLPTRLRVRFSVVPFCFSFVIFVRLSWFCTNNDQNLYLEQFREVSLSKICSRNQHVRNVLERSNRDIEWKSLSAFPLVESRGRNSGQTALRVHHSLWRKQPRGDPKLVSPGFRRVFCPCTANSESAMIDIDHILNKCSHFAFVTTFQGNYEIFKKRKRFFEPLNCKKYNSTNSTGLDLLMHPREPPKTLC